MSNFFEKFSKSELIHLLVENTPVAYIVLDDQYRIHYINEFFLKMRNLELDKTLGEKCYNISNGGKMCNNCAVAKALCTGESALISRKDILPNGDVRFVDDFAFPLSSSPDLSEKFILEIMVNRTPEMLARERRDNDFLEIISILTALLDLKDKYTSNHSQSVRKYSTKLAHALGLSEIEVSNIAIASSLHDIGKIWVPRAIINKTDKLTNEEFQIIKDHVARASDLIDKFPSFRYVRNIIRHHHERVDGRGYPDGLTGDQLSVGEKIVSIADTYDAITSTRSYRKALSHEFAIEEIKRVSGSQLDAEIAEVFINMDFDKDFELTKKSSNKVERVLFGQTFIDQNENIAKTAFLDHSDNINFLEKIFECTPYGYSIIDRNFNIQYASKNFTKLLGISPDILNKKCYKSALNVDSPCEVCSIATCFNTGKSEYVVKECDFVNGKRIFDMHAIPLIDNSGNFDFALEVIIDRTKEILLHRQREQDFSSLIETLNDIIQNTYVEENDISEEVISLKSKLKSIVDKIE